ncbi:MAG: NifU family protein [Polyangiaceae bacterium]|nr:NifU family protein [Polyangiaceae bacterium]
MPEPPPTVQSVLAQVLAPLIAADGGELYLVAASADEVHVHLAGRFAGCPGNELVVRRVIEPALLAALPGGAVRVSSGALIPQGAERVAPAP